MKTDKKMIVCPSCGGRFEAVLSKCPYCGNTNLDGAEIEYMHELRNVEKNVEELPEKEFRKNVSIWAKQIAKAIISMIVVIAILFIIYKITTYIDDRNLADQRQEIISEIGRE